ncbi:hypothetical protein B0J12DRAFT_733007 [Macrophomina phaseolina]|uniref:Extracellular membrane protein CFEM domain-containing protein n=1 Tax=Macrophomina phaseolina TaxID=35725 RepID=A0ABQ8FTI5_9PEZI|nr:hypothetical protein B0J12DRAFT_733007 [Macrophomina phaseolina]
MIWLSGLLLLLGIFCLISTAQVPTPTDLSCIGSASATFPACDKANNRFSECGTITDQAKLVNCVILQGVCAQANYRAMSLLRSCEGEVQQCMLSNTFDSSFEEVIDEWHAKCDAKMASPVTTPPLPPLSTSIEAGVGLGVCSSIIESCNSWQRDASACKSSYTSSADILSCQCAPSLVSLASVCEYDGNVSCILTTAATTNLWEYRNCPSARNAMTAGVGSTSTSRVSTTGASADNTATQQPTFVLPSSTGTATATSGSAGAFDWRRLRIGLLVHCTLLVLSIIYYVD